MRLLVTGTRRILTENRLSPHLGHFIGPRSWTTKKYIDETLVLWGADNDAFTHFDLAAYRAMLAKLRQDPAGLLFVTAPDVVGDAHATYYHWLEWVDELVCGGSGMDEPLPAAFVGQDGAEDLDLDEVWGYAGAIFIGGSTEWKLSRAAADLIREAKDRGLWVHMGRVNSARRLRIAYDAGCDSVDGSSTSWFPDTKLPKAQATLEKLHKRAPRGWKGLQTQQTLFA